MTKTSLDNLLDSMCDRMFKAGSDDPEYLANREAIHKELRGSKRDKKKLIGKLYKIYEALDKVIEITELKEIKDRVKDRKLSKDIEAPMHIVFGDAGNELPLSVEASSPE